MIDFKEIQLVGFKSFADKTSIKFDDGVTCIVGPNGCGKSNVADAVRWVLGEQSAKTMRGSSMQDVIFNGTDTRRQLSYCEVTLVFDNSDKKFDIEYEEVAMTRRLYRSGESEYLINKQNCRLKDIVGLLHGVGIGKEGYSIIGQGRVAQIMNSKPEERRSIFEEATGVIKFKTQKGSIERNLQEAQDNLTVFMQRMDETEKTLRPLEKQAETARKHREYFDQLRYEEVNTYLVRSETFTETTEKHRKKIAETTAQLGEVESRLTEVDASEREGREKIAAVDDALRDLNDKLLMYELGNERKSGTEKVLTERIEAYRRSITEASSDLEYSVNRIKQIDSDVAAGKKKLAENEKRVAALRQEEGELYRKLQEADARLAAFEQLSNEKHASELSSVENLADVKANKGTLSARRDAASERIEEVRVAEQRAKDRKAQYESQLAAIRKEKEECENFLDNKEEAEEELSDSVTELNRSVLKLSQDIVDCNSSIHNSEHNLEWYTDLKNKFDGYRDSVRRLQLEAKRNPEIGKRIKGAIADIVRTEQKYEVALETAFGGAMQNLVTATQDDAQYLIEYLKTNKMGVVTFLPVDAIRGRTESAEITAALREPGAEGLATGLVQYNPYYDNIIRFLLGNTLICDNIRSATRISKKYPRAFKIVTLDGDTIASSGAMTGGYQRSSSGNLLANERLIKECEETIAKKKALLTKLQAALERAEKDLEEAKAEQEQFRIRVQEEVAKFAAVSQRENAVMGLIAETEESIAECAEMFAKLSRTVNDIESEVHLTEETEAFLSRIRSEAAAETEAQLKESGKYREERDALAERLHAAQKETATLESANSAEAENLSRMESEKQMLLSKEAETRNAIRENQNKIDQSTREREEVSLSAEDKRAVKILRDKREEAEAEKRALNEQQAKLAEEKKGLISRQYVLIEERNESDKAITRAQDNLDNMKQRLEEAYELDDESAKLMRDENYDISQSTANINSLKHKINALGAVNFNAEADYADLFARYTEMQTQKEDVEKSIVDLTTALNEIRDEMQRRFDEGFNEINQNFTQIFKELFGGGRAEMQIDYENCDDPLNAGIEIVACPPGKKLSKISLLSGGEQAFTAIAILFAILKNRPMPFCILDEIEAALDEANVDRFARYLKKFSRDTQFIVITHRKPTMNQADSLFGVTMEEKGVSKIVSVKLSEVESKLGGDTIIA